MSQAAFSEGGHPRRMNPELPYQLPLDSDHPSIPRFFTALSIDVFGIGYCAFDGEHGLQGRVCVPVHSASNRLVAYVGYAPGDLTDEKWWHLPDFERSWEIFGLNLFRDFERVTLVLDVIRLRDLGIPAIALIEARTCLAQMEELLWWRSRLNQLHIVFAGGETGKAAADELIAATVTRYAVRRYDLPDMVTPANADENYLRSVLLHLQLDPGVFHPTVTLDYQRAVP